MLTYIYGEISFSVTLNFYSKYKGHPLQIFTPQEKHTGPHVSLILCCRKMQTIGIEISKQHLINFIGNKWNVNPQQFAEI